MGSRWLLRQHPSSAEPWPSFHLATERRAPAQWLSGGGPRPRHTLTAPGAGLSQQTKAISQRLERLLRRPARPGLLAWPWNSTSEFLSRRKRRPRSGQRPPHASPDTEISTAQNLMEFSLFRMMITTTRETFPHSPKEPRRRTAYRPPRPPLLTRTPPWLCTTPSSSPLSDPGPPRAGFLRWPAILCRILSVKESTPCQKMP